MDKKQKLKDNIERLDKIKDMCGWGQYIWQCTSLQVHYREEYMKLLSENNQIEVELGL